MNDERNSGGAEDVLGAGDGGKHRGATPLAVVVRSE